MLLRLICTFAILWSLFISYFPASVTFLCSEGSIRNQHLYPAKVEGRSAYTLPSSDRATSQQQVPSNSTPRIGYIRRNHLISFCHYWDLILRLYGSHLDIFNTEI